MINQIRNKFYNLRLWHRSAAFRSPPWPSTSISWMPADRTIKKFARLKNYWDSTVTDSVSQSAFNYKIVILQFIMCNPSGWTNCKLMRKIKKLEFNVHILHFNPHEFDDTWKQNIVTLYFRFAIMKPKHSHAWSTHI